MSGKMPCARTLDWLRQQGFVCQKVEQFIPWSKTRRDLFGFIDIVAMRKGLIVGVQTTTMAHRADHLQKILSLKESQWWCDAGAHIWLCSWAKRKVKRGGVAVRWEIDVLYVRPENSSEQYYPIAAQWWQSYPILNTEPKEEKAQ